MNPVIDIGQVEGAFVMGLGAYLTEDIYYSKETGQLLNDGTWVSAKFTSRFDLFSPMLLLKKKLYNFEG